MEAIAENSLSDFSAMVPCFRATDTKETELTTSHSGSR